MAIITPTWAIVAMPYTDSVFGTGKSPKSVAPAWQLVTITWANAASASSDTCTAVPAGYLVDLTVQFSGTVTSIALHGSNDGTNYVAVKDGANTAITAIAAAGIFAVSGRVVYIKPVITTGTITTVLCGRLPLH